MVIGTLFCYYFLHKIYVYEDFFHSSPRHINDSGSCQIILQSLWSEWSILPIAVDYGNGWPYQQVKSLWRWRRGLWHTALYHKETRGPILLYLNLISLLLWEHWSHLISVAWGLFVSFVGTYQPWPVFTVPKIAIHMRKTVMIL